MNLWDASIEDFASQLRRAGVQRAWLIHDPAAQAVLPSHPCLQDTADFLNADAVDFDGHEAAFFEVGAESGHLLAAVIHRSARGQAAGGVRYWSYPSFGQFLRDGLRLSRGMGRKSALAGLWWGGGKGVIARREDSDHRDPAVRAAVFRDYGRFISGLHGCYITAEDVGTRPEDMAVIFSQTRYTTCIPQAFGGSGNPSVLTARGVVVAMEAALHSLGMGDLSGKTVAMQGLGNVACHMLENLFTRGAARVVAVDIDETAVAAAMRRFAGEPLEASVTSANDQSIFRESCDIFAANAVGGAINPQTIPLLNTPIVCGAANNQLESSTRDARALAQRDILYVPDFLANRMGIVNCANEQYGVFPGDPAVELHLRRDAPAGIWQRCLEVFERAGKSGHTPVEEAEALADILSLEQHPLWGHRSRKIVEYLRQSHWADDLAG